MAEWHTFVAHQQLRVIGEAGLCHQGRPTEVVFVHALQVENRLDLGPEEKWVITILLWHLLRPTF